MDQQDIELKRLSDLRGRAASRLTGAAGAKGSPASAVDALAVLHALASSPDTASDALALLHELQVHQVELDLQAEEMRDSRAELESALRWQTELYDRQPVGCFTVDSKLVLRQLNQTGAKMIGLECEEACGLPLDSFLSTGSGRTLRSLISGGLQGKVVESSVLRMMTKEGIERAVRAHIGADSTGQLFFVVLASVDEDHVFQAISI